MSTEIQGNSVTNPVSDYAKNVRQEEEIKRINYEAALEQEATMKNSLWNIEKEYNTVQASYKNGKIVTNYNSVKSKYSSALSLFQNASNNVDIARGSYQSAIFFSGKIDAQEIFAAKTLS